MEKGVQKVGSMYGEKVSNSIWANRYSITMPDGRIMGQTSGATLAAREAAESTANSIAKHAGKGLTEVAGTFVGVGIDMWQGDTAEESLGKEITTGIVTGIGVAILGATPIGAGIGVTIGVGVIVGMGNDWLRDNFDGVKEFEDNVGSAIVSGWNTVSNGVSDFFGGVFS
ncbi:hypothetical protein RV18_GL003170 [Enterococcus termitis]|nr:hypothetical protein RV18_GL003170 [Enterococcus termitis]